MLTIGGGVADVFLARSGVVWEPAAQHGDDLGGVVDRQGGLGDVGQPLGVGDLHRLRLSLVLDQDDAALGHLAHGAFDLGVTGVTDQDDLPALGEMALGLHMHLADQRAGGIEMHQLAPLGLGGNRLRHAMGGKDHHLAVGHLVEFVDEHRALFLERFDHEAVVHDLVADVDGTAELGQRLLDDLDGTIDTGAEAARAGEENGEVRL